MIEGLRISTKKPGIKNKSSKKRNINFSQARSSPADRILFLQRTLGNKKVRNLIRSGALQTKHTSGQHGNITGQYYGFLRGEGHIESTRQNCSTCENKQSMELMEKPHPTKGSGFPDIEAMIGTLGGKGQPLQGPSRTFFETRFRHDFSHVRVHTGSPGAELARAVNARAFTVGRDMFFDKGEYAPERPSGMHLLAHELTHVLQQKNSGQTLQGQLHIGKGNDRYEHEAERVAGDVMNGNSVTIPSNLPFMMVQRAMICSKRLEAPVLGWFFNHAYIDDTGRNDCLGAGLTGNYAITDLVSGNFLRGCAEKTDTSPDPRGRSPNSKPCEPKAGVTDVSRCLRDAFNSYNDPSLYANPRGPNSNTFAATLARSCCKDASSKGLGIVPGWNHSPAPPCPARIAFPAPGLPATTLGAGGGFRGLMERDRQRLMEKLRRR